MPKHDQQHPAKGATGNNNPEKTTEKKHEHSELDLTKKADSRMRMEEGEKRTGSDSNATRSRKGERVHEHHKNIKEPEHVEKISPDFAHDLEPNNMAGANRGLPTMDYERTAFNIKELHNKILADLEDDELKNLVLVADGARLEQGAKYIDLKHLAQGEFVATANMSATSDHYYVAKKATDYVLWNRLNQVDNPSRLDESAPEA